MIQIISGTNRKGSRTRQIADIVLQMYNVNGKIAELMDLNEVPLHDLINSPYGTVPVSMKPFIDRVDHSEGLVIVTPEYNGSMPGALKLFIDYWSYPRSFEKRPVCFVGLGYRWGGLRPVEHLQGIFGYRNAFIFPERVFLMNIGDTLKDGKIVDPTVQDLLQKQTTNFQTFIKALKTNGLS